MVHPQPHIMMRMRTLALHHKGESATRIAQLLDRDPRTIRQCLKKYRDELKTLMTLNFQSFENIQFLTV